MDGEKPETKQGFGVGQLGVFVSRRERILFRDDCSSVIPQTVSLSCTLMSKPVSQHLAQQWSIIQKSWQQLRNKSFWMLQLTTDNRRCFPLIKIMCLFSLRALYFHLCRSDKEHSRCELHNTQSCFSLVIIVTWKIMEKHLNLWMNQTLLYHDAVTCFEGRFIFTQQAVQTLISMETYLR